MFKFQWELYDMQNNISEQFQKLHDRQDSLQSELKKNKSSSKPKFEPVVIINKSKNLLN